MNPAGGELRVESAEDGRAGRAVGLAHALADASAVGRPAGHGRELEWDLEFLGGSDVGQDQAIQGAAAEVVPINRPVDR